MKLTLALGVMAIALGTVTPAEAQTRVRVTSLKTPLRETCSETGKVKGTVSEGDELEVVSRDGAGIASVCPAAAAPKAAWRRAPSNRSTARRGAAP